MSVWPSETIVIPPHPAVTFTQSDRPCTHPEPPPLPTAMVRAHSHRCLCGALARERRRRRRGTNAECRTPRRRDARVTSNNARAHVAARRHDRDRDNDSDHDRDRCGPPRRRASCTSCDAAPSLAMAVEVPAVTRRVKRAACHAHRASRARMRTSSPRIARIVTVSVPPAHDRHARATRNGGARSLNRSRARCGVGDGGEGGGRLHRAPCASRKTRVTRVHEHAINAHRARHHRFPFPPGTRELRRRRRSLVARSRARGVA
jgi:hypothetical protein